MYARTCLVPTYISSSFQVDFSQQVPKYLTSDMAQL